jgi:hypothetical protein
MHVARDVIDVSGPRSKEKQIFDEAQNAPPVRQRLKFYIIFVRWQIFCHLGENSLDAYPTRRLSQDKDYSCLGHAF